MARLDPRKSLVQRHFDNSVQYWDKLYREQGFDGVHIQLRREKVLGFIDRLGLPKGARVLEVGCGAGWTVLELARQGYRVDALDIAWPMLEMLRRNCRTSGITKDINFLAGDAENIPVKANSVDLIIMMGVIGFLTEWRSSLRQTFDALKPGGYLVLASPNKWGLSHIINPRWLRLGVWKDKVLGKRHISRAPQSFRHSPGEFRGALRGIAFEVWGDTTHTFGPFYPLGQKVFPDRVTQKLHHVLQTLSDRRALPGLHHLGKAYIVVARKPHSGGGNEGPTPTGDVRHDVVQTG